RRGAAAKLCAASRRAGRFPAPRRAPRRGEGRIRGGRGADGERARARFPAGARRGGRRMTDMRVEAIGNEAQPLLIFDDFAPDPDALRHFAAATEFVAARNHYPGVRAALPEAYLATQLPLIAEAVAAAFGRQGPLHVVDASFSIVSTPPGALTIAQRLP